MCVEVREVKKEYHRARQIWYHTVFPHAIILLFLCLTLVRKIDDFDIWYHLSIGREIFHAVKIPTVELFVYPHLGEPVSYHEWGFGLLFYSVFRLANYWGISLLNALLGGLSFFFLYRAAQNEKTVTPVSPLILGCMFWLIEYRLIYRPEMILFLFLGAEIFLLERFDRDGKLRWLLPVPILSFLLTNFHPSALFLLGVLCFYCVQFLTDAPKKGVRRIRLFGILSAVVVSTFLASGINPYGFSQFFLPLRFITEKDLLREIVEFLPTFQTNYKRHFVLLFLMGIISLIFQPRRRIVDWLLFVPFAYLGFRFVRNVALFALVMYVPIAKTFAFYCERYFSPDISRNRKLLWVLSSALFAFIAINPIIKNTWGEGFHEDTLPVKSAETIAELKPLGQIFNFYHTGGYLTWKLYSQYRVFIDGRRYYRDKSLATHDEVLLGVPQWDRILEEYGVNIIVTPATLPFSGKLIPLIPILAEDGNWLLVTAEPGGLLFLKNGSFKDIRGEHGLDKKLVWRQIVVESERTLHSYPDNPNAYHSMGQAYVKLGEYTHAIQAYRNYLRMNPGDENAAQMVSLLELSAK